MEVSARNDTNLYTRTFLIKDVKVIYIEPKVSDLMFSL